MEARRTGHGQLEQVRGTGGGVSQGVEALGRKMAKLRIIAPDQAAGHLIPLDGEMIH
jgi:hypothetical protein